MRNKDDLRIVKTKKALFTSLINLMGEKSFEEIKIQDICKNALINRSTFYAHYNDKYELLSDYINELKLDLFDTLNKNTNESFNKKYFIEMIHLILIHIDMNKNIYSNVFLHNRSGIFMDMILDICYKFLSEKIKKSEDSKLSNIPPDFISKFYFGAIMYTCFDCIRNNNSYSNEEIISYIDKLVPNFE